MSNFCDAATGKASQKKRDIYSVNCSSIQPQGWLANQLQIQLDGLTGHLDEFWPSVKDSAWFGGELPDMERALYWLDGAIPLAWQLDDAELKGRIAGYMNGIMDRQRSDGALGPMDCDESNLDRSRSGDPWSHILAAKVMALYHDVTGEQRVFDSLVRYLKYLSRSFAREAMNCFVIPVSLFWGSSGNISLE